MYVWDLKGLKEELRSTGISEGESVKYLLTYAVGFTLTSGTGIASNLSLQSLVFMLVSLVFVVGGIIYCFKMNGGEKGRDFLKRYFSIGWVIVVRTTVIGIPVLFLSVLLFVGLAKPSNDSAALVGGILGSCLALVAIVVQGFQIKDVAGKDLST